MQAQLRRVPNEVGRMRVTSSGSSKVETNIVAGDRLLTDREIPALAGAIIQPPAVKEATDLVLKVTPYDLFAKNLIRTLNEKATSLKTYVTSQESPKKEAILKAIDESMTAVLEFFTTSALFVTREYLSPAFLDFVEKQFKNHDFGKPSEPIDLIEKKINGFRDTMRHLTAVNRRKVELADRSETDPVGAIYHSSLALQDLLDIFASIHDFGKYGPPKTDKGLNDYGGHPYWGEKKLIEFVVQEGKSIIIYDKLPRSLQRIFSEADFNNMLIGLQVGHLVLAGPALGENSKLTWSEFVRNPRLQAIFSNPEKRQLFLQALALVTMTDVGSYGFLTDEKVAFYLQSIKELDGLITENLGKPQITDFGKMEASKAVKAMAPANVSMETALKKHFEERLEWVLSANTPNKSKERENGYLSTKFYEFLKANYSETDARAIIEKLTHFFATSLKLEYFRHFFQLLLLNDTRSDDPKKAYAEFKGFNKLGLDFFIRFIEHVEAKRIENGIMPEGLVLVRTGTINFQGRDPNSQAFYQAIVLNPEKWPAFFATCEAKFDAMSKAVRLTYSYI